MTPKEKAQELLDSIYDVASDIEFNAGDSSGYTAIDFDSAKNCALITVNQILDIIRYHGTDIGSKYSLSFWLDVERELNAL